MLRIKLEKSTHNLFILCHLIGLLLIFVELWYWLLLVFVLSYCHKTIAIYVAFFFGFHAKYVFVLKYYFVDIFIIFGCSFSCEIFITNVWGSWLDLLTYCHVVSHFLVCDTSAAFSICDVIPFQHFLSCASSLISARSFLECSLIECWISVRPLLNTLWSQFVTIGIK